MEHEFNLYDGSKENVFSNMKMQIEHFSYTLEYAMELVYIWGHSVDEFLIYYRSHESEIYEMQEFVREMRWNRILSKYCDYEYLDEYQGYFSTLNLKEMTYCFSYLEPNKAHAILDSLSKYYNGVKDVKLVDRITKDKRRLAKALIDSKINKLLDRAYIDGYKISYKADLAPLLSEFPFLHGEIDMMLKFFKKKGITVIDKPSLLNFPKQVYTKYFTKTEQDEAKKKAHSEYQRKKNIANQYSIDETIKSASRDPYERCTSYTFDANEYINKRY